jgi:hypothetical protein
MRRIGRALALVAVFLGVLYASTRLVNRIDPFREVPTLREKWDYWLEHKDEYDTVFIGTSRIYRGLKPAVFDEVTAAGGLPTKTFNFGVDGMLPPEDAYVAEYVLRNPGKNLRWVFLELGVFVEDFEDRDPNSVRSAHWHDWERTWLCIRANLWPKGKKEKWRTWFRSKDGKPWPADVAWTHFRLFFSKSLNLGRGAAALEEYMLGKGPKMRLLGENSDGYNAYKDARTLKGEGLAYYMRLLDNRQRNPAKLSTLKTYHQECFDDSVKAVRATPAKPIALIGPTTGPLRLRPAESSGVPVIDLCDVQAYPQLFTPDVRVDHAHLNDKGADIFTRMVATQFLQVARGLPPGGPTPASAPDAPAPTQPPR